LEPAAAGGAAAAAAAAAALCWMSRICPAHSAGCRGHEDINVTVGVAS